MGTEALKQSIGLSSIGNARELGGYPGAGGRTVRHGVLLRTAKLSTAAVEDLVTLSKKFRVARVIDLRSDEEINGAAEAAMFTNTYEPDRDLIPEGAEYMHLPIFDMQKMVDQINSVSGCQVRKEKTDLITALGVAVEAGILGDSLYFAFLDDDPGKSSFARIFRELISLEEGRALLFHCNQGKDRTGVTALLILSALGVSEDVIVSDYMLTNVFNRQRIEGERRMLEASGKISPDKIDTYLMAMDCVKESTMTSLLAHIKERYGSVTDYIINELGVTESEIELLRDKFLEQR
ncbi:MAG: tyrosine-protein phosphatase [Ruminococcus sp.]|nr:tyrosine-protein phosphatase [Ruminococcus sp.]